MIPINGLVTVGRQCGGCGGSGLSPTYGDWHECSYCMGTGDWFEIVHVTSVDKSTLIAPIWPDDDMPFINQELTRRLIGEIE